MISPKIGEDSDLTLLMVAGLPPKTAYLTVKYVRHSCIMVSRSCLKEPGKAFELAQEAILNAWERRILSTDQAREMLSGIGFDAEAHRLEWAGSRPRRNILQRVFDRMMYG